MIKMPTLRDVLWEAQEGHCWRCEQAMIRQGHNIPRAASLDHVFPRSLTGELGDIGLCLLAHRSCDNNRQPRWPTDAEVRRLVEIYRSIPAWWLQLQLRGAHGQIKPLRRLQLRASVLSMILKEDAA